MKRWVGSRIWSQSIPLLLALASASSAVQAAEGPARFWFGGGVLAARTLTSGSGHANLSILRLEGGWRLTTQTELGFEVSPYTNVRQPDTFRGDDFENVYAFSAAFLIRRHFDLPLRPFVEGSAGLIKSSRNIPAETTDLNFMLTAGAGIVLMARSAWSLIGSYRLIHISNADREVSNPGYNMQSLGVTVRFDFFPLCSEDRVDGGAHE